MFQDSNSHALVAPRVQQEQHHHKLTMGEGMAMDLALQYLLLNSTFTPSEAALLADQWPDLISMLSNTSSDPCKVLDAIDAGVGVGAGAGAGADADAGTIWSALGWQTDDSEIDQFRVEVLYLLGHRQLNNTTSVLTDRLSATGGHQPFSNLHTVQRQLNTTNLLSLNYSGAEFYLVAVLLISLTIWTAIGSLLVDLSIVKFRSLRTVPNILVGNLSLSDFLLAITILPMSIANDLLGYWIFGRWLCYIWLVSDVLYCTASIWSLCVIAFDRFTATVFPIWYRDQRSPQRAVLYIVADWVLSLIIIIPPMTGWMKLSDCYLEDKEHPGLMQCQLFSDEIYVVYSSMGSFIVPLLVMCLLYGKIFTVLWKRTKQSKKETKMRSKNAVSVSVSPLVAISSSIQCKQMKNSAMTETNASIEATLTIKPEVIDGGCRKPATGEKRVLHIKVDNTLQIATIRNRCATDQSRSAPTISIAESSNDENPVEHSNTPTPAHVDQTVTDTLAIDGNARVARGISFQSSWDRLRRKSSLSQMESESAEDTETQCSRTTGKVQCPKRSLSQRRKYMSRSKSLHRRETQATLRAMMIIILFVLCWMPFTVMYVVGGFMKEQFYLNPHAIRFIIWLGYANSAINPLLIFCYNNDFRAAFKAIAYSIFCGLARARPGMKARNSTSRFEQYRRNRRKGAVCHA